MMRHRHPDWPQPNDILLDHQVAILALLDLSITLSIRMILVAHPEPDGQIGQAAATVFHPGTTKQDLSSSGAAGVSQVGSE